MITKIRPRYLVVTNDQTDLPRIVEDHEIIIEDQYIIYIGKTGTADHTADEIVDLPHHVVTPGLINTHNHSAMTLFRGYADDYHLKEWLEDHIWPMEQKLDRDIVYIGAKFAAVEALMFGTTTLNSMYWYPEGEIQAFQDIGVRLMVGPPVISGVTDIKQYKPLVERYHGDTDDMTRISLNPHAPYTVEAEDFLKIKKFKNEFNQKNTSSAKLVMNTHLAESGIEMDLIRDFAREKGFDLPATEELTPVSYLDNLGVLDEQTIAAHVVECSPEDIAILQEREVGLAINIASNMKLGNNIPPLDKMVHNYHKVGIGTDGPSSNNNLDMFETIKLSSLAIKSKENNPTLLPANKMLDIATRGGAAALGWDSIGEIRAGKRADLIAINLRKPHLRPITNPYSVISHLIYAANGNDVSHTMINGQWKMKDSQLVDQDIEMLMDEFDEVSNIFFSRD